MTAALYIRVSTQYQAQEGYSLPAQRRALTDYCHYNKLDIYNIYADEGISAKDMTHRPSFLQMMEQAKSKCFDVIVFYSLSRFTRSVSDLYFTWDMLKKFDISLISLTESFDTNTVVGRACMGILGVFAQMERELTSERVSFAMRERARQGKRTCVDVLGYSKYGSDSLIIDPDGADLVRLIFSKFIKYQKYLPVADLLNAMGKTGCRGRNFRAESIKLIVTNPIYIGYYRYKGERIKGNFEPIIDNNTWQHAQRIVLHISRNKHTVK